MAEGNERIAEQYKALKQRLWNQPRPQEILGRFEHHGALPALLEKVAKRFVSGQHGEAEILAAFYYDLLRHQDRTEVISRITDLRVIFVQIQ